ncbi:MAG: hypothetical protein CMP59_11990 [Flavobacteriales bacterium]|nr:hypothetical protein [Flavobacteriales bacterium]|tara:strand:- start:99 stop:488 length:390 start_codon:yes stop_codon:yes gene_type:complete
MRRSFLSWAFFFGLTAVINGAMASHALSSVLGDSLVDSFQTGVRYQMYHAILLMVLGFQPYDEFRSKLLLWLIVSGTICFSFSIYLLSTRELIGIEGLENLGPITPIGGTLLIIGWTVLLIKSLRKAYQ